MIDLASWPLWAIVAALVGAAVVIGVAGTRLAHVADELADRTGTGEVIAGALFVGASTSLPGIITSVVTAGQGYPELAIGNALGGLTVQTAFLAVADIAYRRANLEHAAASVTGLTQGTLLVSMLTIPLLAATTPQVTVLGLHPASLVLCVSYLLGLRLMARVKDAPMWSPVETHDTEREVEGEEDSDRDPRSDARLWTEFALAAGVTGAAGYVVSQASIALVDVAGLSQTAVGTVFSAFATSMPELVTALAAVRIGAPHLALGDVIGGNIFDLLFLAAADAVYREGSIYHAFTAANTFTAALAILMTGVLLLGMLRRERFGVGGIGFESALVLLLYAGSAALILS